MASFLNKTLPWRSILGLVGTGLALYGLWRFRDLLAYMLIAVAISFMGRPMVVAIHRIRVRNRPIPTGLAAAVTLTVFLAVAAALLYLFLPMIIAQAETVRQMDLAMLDQMLSEQLHWLDQNLGDLDLSGRGIPNSQYVMDELSGLLGEGQITQLLTDLLSGLGELVVAVFSIVFMSFFFLKDGALFRNIISSVTPDGYESKVDTILNRTTALLSRYFIGLVIQIGIITAVVTVGLLLVGAEHAFLLGLIAGVFNLVPYVGPIVGTALGMLLVAASHAAYPDQLAGALIGAGITYLVAQLIDNLFTQPVIFASSVNAHPLEIYLVIAVAGSLGGVVGMMLAIPGYTLFRIVAREFLSGFKVIDRLTHNL
jgi:predicted PurR-regulated permease PerM